MIDGSTYFWNAKFEQSGSDLEMVEKDITTTTKKLQGCDGVFKEHDSAMTSYNGPIGLICC